MDGLPHGLQEELVIGVKAPVGDGTFWIMFHINPHCFYNLFYHFRVLPLCNVGQLHTLFQQRFLILQQKEKENHMMGNNWLYIQMYSI